MRVWVLLPTGNDPTAQASVALRLVTPRSVPPGLGAMLQAAPSQWRVVLLPTAQASFGAWAVTPYSGPLPGLGDRLQTLPSQCRMPVSPTAQPSLAPRNATPLSRPA